MPHAPARAGFRLPRPRPLPLERFYGRWEFRVRHNLSASDPEPLELTELVELMDPEVLALWEGLRLGYAETQGHPLLRAEIAAQYRSVGPEEVIVTTGAQEAIYLSMRALVAPGRHVVVVAPAYELLHEAARVAGADVTLVDLDPHAGWRLDPEALLGALRQNTSVVAINFPHNPTGALPERAALAEIAAECGRRGVCLLSDEVFRGLEESEPARWPAAVDVAPGALSLGDLSKSYGLAGLRVGWIACRDPDVLERIATWKDYLTICGAAPSQILALAALRASDVLHARARAIVSANRETMSAFLARHADLVEWTPPVAGTTAFPRLRATDADAFCERLAREEGILLAPGSLFGKRGGYFRLGLGRRDLDEALPALERAIRRGA